MMVSKAKDKEKEKKGKKIEDQEEVRKREQNQRRIDAISLKDLKAFEIELLSLIEHRESMLK